MYSVTASVNKENKSDVHVKGMEPTGCLAGITKPSRFDRCPGGRGESVRLSSPSLTAESSPLVSSPLTRPLPTGWQRSHLTAEYTLSQALSLSLSHTFAPAPRCPFLNFPPSLHYLILSISPFHALNLSYCSASFHLLSVSLSSFLPAWQSCTFFCFHVGGLLLCHSGLVLSSLSLPVPSRWAERHHVHASIQPSLFLISLPVPLSLWHISFLCFVLHHNDGTSRVICPWLAELCV